MSQNDFSIANQGFPSFRGDLNSALQALASNSGGDTEPATTYAYQWWYDSTADALKIRNADNDAWITFATFDQAADSWSLDINGGTIDGTVIGGSSAAAGTFTALTSNGIDDNATSTAMTLDTSGNVGIGTSSPSADLEIASDNANIQLTDTDDSGYSQIRHNTGSLIFEADKGDTTASSAIRFDVDNTEAMRIDSSGNLLVGKTAQSTSTVGVELRENGKIVGTIDGNNHTLNRLTSNGDILKFQKDSTAAGTIGIEAGGFYIDGEAQHTGLRFGGASVNPRDNGVDTDNNTDLGSANYRWDDVYATNGTIQTSDRNEKQGIEALSDAEQRVAVACKGLLRKFRWIDAVAEKGDDARIHFGIIAQDLQDAFTAEGLDAGRYAMFISTTWWETQTDVPAVEAVAEVLDEEGNVVTEAVEAKDAYTRTDTYETLEEAPEGATERTRLGVRYPELLAFIISAI